MATVCRFGDRNLTLLTTTTVTASSALVNRPAANLKSPARWKKWRSSTSTGNQDFTVDFGTPMLIRAIALVDYKVHQGGGIRADYWDGAAFQPFGTYTIPASNPTGVIVLWDTVGKLTSKIKPVFLNTIAANDYVEAGVIYAGSYTEPVERGLDVEFAMYPVDPSTTVVSIGQQEESQKRPIYRMAEGLLKASTRTALDQFRPILDRLGLTDPFLFAADPANVDETLYARLSDLKYPSATDRGDFWQMPLTVKEVR
jgi:hypothetical protein